MMAFEDISSVMQKTDVKEYQKGGKRVSPIPETHNQYKELFHYYKGLSQIARVFHSKR
jgi:hypothetical protein